jgi:enoyl-CoA hydratase/carnithine racemase
VPIQKRHLAPDFGVGRWFRILEIFHIFLRFESTARLELGHKLPFLDGHWRRDEGLMTNNAVLYDVQEGVATLTLNRSEVMHAINRDLVRSLAKHLDAIRLDPGIRVVVVTGAGDKAFCAGADLKERATLTAGQVEAFLFSLRQVINEIEQLPQPVIAAINGWAFGGGLELVLVADIRLAADSAVMGLTETRLAIIPGGGGTQRLPRLIGRGKAKELIFTGRRIGAAEALSMGMVNQICPPNRLVAESLKMAGQIAEAGPIAVRQAKFAIDAGLESDLQTGLSIEAHAYQACIPTEDRLEGLAAFKEKRKPVYKGK